MKIKILSLVALLAMTGQATGTFYTSDDLLNMCESESPERQICYGYMAGIVDAISTVKAWEDNPDGYFCLPNGVTTGQLRKIFIKHANDNPEKLHLAADSAVIIALLNTFPCK